jgi:putative redox protein
MPTEYVVQAEHHGGFKVRAQSGGQIVEMDYPMGVGALTPLELLLVSLAGCSTTSLAVLLQKSKQPFKKLSVRVRGIRREAHPTIFTTIDLEFTVAGEGVDAAEVERCLKLSEEKICPVWAMLKPGVAIHSTYRLESTDSH